MGACWRWQTVAGGVMREAARQGECPPCRQSAPSAARPSSLLPLDAQRFVYRSLRAMLDLNYRRP